MSHFVELMTLSDPLEAAMIKELLEEDGIPVSAPGLMHRGMLGMVGSFVDIRLEVPEEELERARELVASMRVPDDEGEDDDGEDDDGEADDDGEDQGVDAPRQKRVAAFCALALTFGCGHFYARSYRVGLTLLILELGCFALVFGGATAAILGLPILVLADLSGAFVAVDRYNGVAREDLWARATLLGPLLALVAIAAVPALHRFAPERLVDEPVAQICEAQARCAEGDAGECVERFARRVVELRPPPPGTDACAACVAEHGPSCADLEACAGRCGSVARVTPDRAPHDDPFGLRRRFRPLDADALPAPFPLD